MTKKFKFIALVALSVMVLTALGAGVVAAQTDNSKAWNPSVSQNAVNANCGNCDCAGQCDGVCDGTCNGDCSGNGKGFGKGLCGQSNGGCEGGNCGQLAFKYAGKQAGCNGGGCR